MTGDVFVVTALAHPAGTNGSGSRRGGTTGGLLMFDCIRCLALVDGAIELANEDGTHSAEVATPFGHMVRVERAVRVAEVRA